jgi:glycosyltransferase involved in cell wall biosynthesis
MVWFAVDDIADHYKNMNIKKLVVGNFPSIEKFNSILQNRYEKKNQFVFVGSMDVDRSITQIIEAFAIFSEQNTGFALVLAGPFYSEDYEYRVNNLIQSYNLKSRVKLLGTLEYESAMQIIAESKIGFSLHQPTYNYLRGMPLKLFEYIGLAIPVIASNFPNFKTIVEKNNCGICVDPNKVDDIVDAMIYMTAHETERSRMGENGKQIVQNKYNWENISTKITLAIKELYNHKK